MKIRRASLLIWISFGHSFCWKTQPTFSFDLNAAPDALVYSICGLTTVEFTDQPGNWTRGIHAALLVNESYIFEKFMRWGIVDSLVQDECLTISVDPKRLSSGQAFVRALLCDAQKLCMRELMSPALKIGINDYPFSVDFLDVDSGEYFGAETSALIHMQNTVPQPLAKQENKRGSKTESLEPLDKNNNNRSEIKPADDEGLGSKKADIMSESAILPNKTAVCGSIKKQIESTSKQLLIDQAPADTLILFAFSHSDGWREENLLFWLARGLVPDSRYHFVLIVNGSIDAAWRRLLDRVSAGLTCFEWHQRPDAGRDVCAWHSVLSGSVRLRRALASFARFVLTNASCRGPFLPGYYLRPWPEAFLSVIGARVVLSGVTLHCDCLDPHPRSERCVRGPDLHIQSYLLAFGAGLLPLVLDLQRQACVGNVPGGSRSAWWFEKAVTRAVLAGGGGLAVKQAVWAGVDFRDAAAVSRVCAAEAVEPGADGDPIRTHLRERYPDLHPAEAVFFKTNRRVAADTLHSYTRSALENLPWSVPPGVLCA